MRAAVRIFARDLRRIVTNPVALVVTLGVCLIPSLYAWVNILANWDPYQSTGTVPVAVVVEDAGAEVPGMGPVNAGQMVRERLEENHQLGWDFVDEKDRALEGVRSGRYYAAFVIPRDFTATLAGALDGRPAPARVGYYVNEKVSAVAPKVTDTGATELETQIASEFVRTAGEAVSEKVVAAAARAAGAAGGARADAAAALGEVGSRLDGLAGTLDGAQGDIAASREAVARAEGALGRAALAADELSTSVDAGLGELGQAREQARSLAADLSGALGEGSAALAGLASTAGRDVGAIAGDVGWAQGQLSAAISQLRAASGTLRSLRSSLQHARDAVAAATPSDDACRELQSAALAGLDDAMGALDELADAQDARLDGLQAASDEVAAGAGAMRDLAGGVAGAAQDGADALAGLRADVAQGVSPELSAALDELGDAGGHVAGAIGAVGPLARQAQGTLEQLDALLAQCDGTLGRIAESARDAAGRMGALAGELTAAGSAEAGTLDDVLALDPSSVGAALGSPVELVDEAVFPVANYGSGVAPFYTNLALWVGGFVLVAIYKLEVDQAELDALGAGPREAFFGRWLLLALLGQVQALVCCVGDVALGIQCVSPAAYVFAGMMASLVYVLAVFALASAFRHVGKALAVLLVVLQIPGASGLYPIQMQPGFFRALEPWLPFTYGINAMREAVAGFYDGNYARDLALLMCFAVPALILGVGCRRALAGVNDVFDRATARTDLLVSERVGRPREGRLAAVVDALAASPVHRAALLSRAERFERAYPRMVRGGLAALALAPVALTALSLVVHERFVLLALWVAALAGASAWLMGVEYAHDRLASRAALARRGRDELVGMARDAAGEKDGEL